MKRGVANPRSDDEICYQLEQMIAENNLSFTDLVYHLQEGSHKGTSALWWLACEVSNGRSAAFQSVWDKYKDVHASQLIRALLVQAQAGQDKDKSALWSLAFAVTEGNSKAFLSVWHKFKGTHALQLLEGLLAQVHEGQDKGKSALWLLAWAAANHKPEAFLSVWDTLKGCHAPHLLEALLLGPDKDESALIYLIITAQREGKKTLGPFKEILKNILTDFPGVIPESEIQDLNSLGLVAPLHKAEFLPSFNSLLERCNSHLNTEVNATRWVFEKIAVNKR